MPESSARALFAARLVQARQLRGLSQRALGDLMGLGKDKGSSRINRYERQVTAIGFDNLEKLAEVLDVPVAYLLADSASMADAILELSKAGDRQLAPMVAAIKGLAETPALAKALAKMLQLPRQEQLSAIEALQVLVAELGRKRNSA